MLEPLFLDYADIFKQVYSNEKVYMCISVIGCKGVTSEGEEFYWFKKEIDRNLVLCSPVYINDLNDEDEVTLVLKKLYIEFLLSIGVTNSEELTELIREVYDV